MPEKNITPSEVAERRRRREAFERLADMAEAGDFDVLLDKRNYRPRPETIAGPVTPD